MTEPQPIRSDDRDARFQDQTANEVVSSNALAAVAERARRAESRLAAIEGSRAWLWVGKYRRVRDRFGRKSPGGNRPESTPDLPATALGDGLEIQARDRIDAAANWAELARKSLGDQVFIMFSEAPEYHHSTPTRPNRLARVLLDRGCPVFFSYYRTDLAPLPSDGPNPLLVQSPLDVTARVLPHVLEADFGDKRKYLFVAFPDLVMVRYLRYAQQLGWKVVCDAEADWEEYAMAGAAPWYHPMYERYVIQCADAVTAVSDRLAEKLTLEFGRKVVVVPNAHDSNYPVREVNAESPPIMGYFGSLTHRWFDWKLLLRAARLYPEIRFELIGEHVPPGVRLPENIAYLGCLSDVETVNVAARWTGAVVPYKIGPLVDAIDIISAYEFVYLGLRTVATYSPQLVQFPGFVASESPESFLELVGSLAQSEMPRDGSGVQWLVGQTWEDRLVLLENAVETAEPPSSMAAFLIGLGT